jgi:TDG/mug DNA glycosylase family protein
VSEAKGSLSTGFPPIVDSHARVLVLGSLPGQRSLQMQQYYAQPQNAFWRIMGVLFGAGLDLPYEQRAARLRKSGIALWDVVAAAERDGSLDASIVTSSIIVNDFAKFFARQRGIELVCFNGAKAAQLYRRRVLPTLPQIAAALPLRALPSTSPAHASLAFEQKLEHWAAALRDQKRNV